MSQGFALGVRGELRADGTRCPRCFRLASHAQIDRIIDEQGNVDVLLLCRGCGQPTVIAWSRDAA
jgi:hypothetical protein